MLVTILIVLLLLGLAIYGLRFLTFVDEPLKSLIGFVLVVIAVIYIARSAGL